MQGVKTGTVKEIEWMVKKAIKKAKDVHFNIKFLYNFGWYDYELSLQVDKGFREKPYDVVYWKDEYDTVQVKSTGDSMQDAFDKLKQIIMDCKNKKMKLDIDEFFDNN